MEVFACDVILVGSLGTIITEMEEITSQWNSFAGSTRTLFCQNEDWKKYCLSPKFVNNHFKSEGIACPEFMSTSATPVTSRRGVCRSRIDTLCIITHVRCWVSQNMLQFTS